jgi:hypothetical protein
MHLLTGLWSVAVGGVSAVGVSFLFKTFVKSGIEESVKLNFKKHLEDYRAQLRHEMEHFKASLRNAETVFVRQLEALTSLRRIFRKILPKPSTPHADWDDACQEIAHSFEKHADALDEFLGAYGAVLPPEVLQKIERAASHANEGSFRAFGRDHRAGETEPTEEGIKMAEEFYDLVKGAVSDLQRVVDGQVATRNASPNSGG